jgi:hypothetical protein
VLLAALPGEKQRKRDGRAAHEGLTGGKAAPETPAGAADQAIRDEAAKAPVERRSGRCRLRECHVGAALRTHGQSRSRGRDFR